VIPSKRQKPYYITIPVIVSKVLRGLEEELKNVTVISMNEETLRGFLRFKTITVYLLIRHKEGPEAMIP